MISSFRFRIGAVTCNTLCYYASKSQTREAKQLKKMIDDMQRRKNVSGTPPKLLEKLFLPKAYHNDGLTKRQAALNKIYMEHITVMINGGSYGAQFQDLGIEISKVHIAGGFNFLAIYWISRKDGIPEDVIHKVLSGALRELQEQMGALRFTSKVPFLKFVKDVRLEREISLNKLFETADFGPGYDPVHGKKVQTEDFVSPLKEMPEMRQNVLGLDHAKIKGRIMADIKRFKAINTEPPKEDRTTEAEEKIPKDIPHKLIQFTREDFSKFYKRKKALEYKMRKNYVKEKVEYVYGEMEEESDDDEEYAYDEEEIDEKKS